MRKEQSHFPKLTSTVGGKWAPKFWSDPVVSPFALPSGKSVAMEPIINLTNAALLAKGVSHIAYNQGIESPDLPISQRAAIIGVDMIKDRAPGGKPLSTLTESECYAVADSILSSRGGGYGILTSQMNEVYPEDPKYPWAIDPNTKIQQSRWIESRLASQLAQVGGTYHSGYDGCINLNSATEDFTTFTSLRAALNNPNTAFSFASANSGFGDLFFRDNAYLYRDGTVQTYWIGYANAHKRQADLMCRMLVARQALVSKGSNRSLLAFMWPNQDQFAGPLVTDKHTVPDTGGVVTTLNFARYSQRQQVILAFYSLVFCEKMYLWEDGIRRGLNPNVIRDLNLEGPQYSYAGGSGSPQRAGFSVQYTASPTAYFDGDFTGWDATMAGVLMFSRAVKWAGSSWQFARVRPAGSSTWSTPNGNAYVLDRYEQNQPVVIRHQTGTRRSVFAFCNAYGVGQTEEWEVDLDGATDVLDLDGSTAQHWLYDLNG